MKLNNKTFKILKIQKHFKTSNLFFLANGIDRTVLDWLLSKQGLKTNMFNHLKVLNKPTKTTLNNSVYNNVSQIITGSTFLLKPEKKKQFSKQTVLTTFNRLFFELLIVKINNKAYSINTLKNTYSLKYKENKLLFYQFNIASIKISSSFSK